MKFNVAAFVLGLICVIILNALLAFLLTLLFVNSCRLFLEYKALLLVLYSIIMIIVNFAWFWYLFKYFNNGKTSDSIVESKISKDDTFVSKLEIKNHRCRLFLILGSILALFVSTYFYYYYYNGKRNEIYRIQTTSIKVNVQDRLSSKLKSIATTLSASLDTPNSSDTKTGTWEKIYTSELDCFKQIKAELDNIINQNGMNDNIDEFIDNWYDPKSNDRNEFANNFEFWIDPDDAKHVKIRFYMNIIKNEGRFRDYSYVNYFTIVPDPKFLYAEDISDDWTENSDYLIYDSNTGSAAFENDGFLSILINNPNTLLTFLYIIILLINFIAAIKMGLKELSKSRLLNGQKKYVRNYKINR